jgi:membrane associated rhomboid family serine protease
VLILPLGHEHHTAKRWPWLTMAVVVLNVVAFVGSCASDRRTIPIASEKERAALLYYAAHPYLAAKPPLGDALRMHARPLGGASDPSIRRVRDHIAEAVGDGLGGVAADPTDPPDHSLEQAELDHLTADFDDALHGVSAYAYGYVPSENGVLGLVTHQFLHAGVLHLLGNLWFLWLVGCNIEDGWGRGVFPIFYVVAGVVAALTHKLLAWSSPLPLIGASGAISGAMGAFLVRHASTKLRFFALLFYRPITFWAPASLMLPLWAGVEVLDGLAAPPGGGVAHWAHVGGFAFGVGFALLMKRSGVEEQIEAAIEQKETIVQDPRLAAAAELTAGGRAAEAIDALERLAAEQPWSVDVMLELLRAATAASDVTRAEDAKARLIEIHLYDQNVDAALELYGELVAEDARQALAPQHRLRMARQIERSGDLDRAVCEYCELYRDPEAGPVALAAMIGHGEVSLKQGRRAEATALFGYALEHLHLDPALEPVIRRGLARATSGASVPPPNSQ